MRDVAEHSRGNNPIQHVNSKSPLSTRDSERFNPVDFIIRLFSSPILMLTFVLCGVRHTCYFFSVAVIMGALPSYEKPSLVVNGHCNYTLNLSPLFSHLIPSRKNEREA